ncbi:Gfo/Idh/MocA family protein, partial [Marinimicrobium sp. UBA4509]
MNKIRWGVLSTANIGRKKVIPAIQASERGEVVAVGSRSEDSARAFADELGIPVAHGSYEALLADPNIDAIYNPLPNHLHV